METYEDDLDRLLAEMPEENCESDGPAPAKASSSSGKKALLSSKVGKGHSSEEESEESEIYSECYSFPVDLEEELRDLKALTNCHFSPQWIQFVFGIKEPPNFRRNGACEFSA